MTKLEGYLKQFVVQFSGLKLGVHEFEFEIVDLFFEQFVIEDVTGGDIHVKFTLDKKENMMELNFELTGVLKTTCDRCLDPMEIDLVTDNQIMVKFSEATSEANDELIVLGPEAYKIDIAPIIYEFITVQFPLRKVHDEEDCNQDVINMLYTEEDKTEEENEGSNMWDALKKLK
ncbi:MAG: YceD family protein [Salibacteraceae bacterium]